MYHSLNLKETRGNLRRRRRSFSKEGKAATGGARAAAAEIPTAAGAAGTKAEVPGEGGPGREEVHRLGEEGGEFELEMRNPHTARQTSVFARQNFPGLSIHHISH